MGILSMQHQTHQQQQQGPQPPQLHHSRPSSVVHQQPQAQPPPPQQHHQGPYSSSHSLTTAYPPNGQSTNTGDNLPSYYSHPGSYNASNTNSGYTSADTSEMMAAAQMPRPYPPMSYHTPQSNSPSSVPSPSQHDQHRSLYGQPPSQHMPQSMYYQQPPYQSMPHQPSPSPYGHAAQHAQQPMTSQPNMMMSHPAPHNPMSQHAPQHGQPGMANSPRPKIEPQLPLQLQHKAQNSPMPPSHHPQNNGQLQSPGNAAAGVNPNAAPGPIPATTPPVVRQDGNGVQWIAFEYSRDRVKLEYTIRCDVESVNTEELSQEFKQENCVYPRACCPKDQYRGNRLMYETDCNRVGWALAHLNVPLRGKRGLIQRAVDSWRNSNSDPKLRSRRVRRLTKMNSRKQAQVTPHASPMPGHAGQPGMHSGAPSMGHGGPAPMGKPGLGAMGPPLHHHAPSHPDGPQGANEEVGSGSSYGAHHQQGPPSHGPPGGSDDVRQAHVFAGYPNQGYPTSAPGGSMSHMAPHSSSTVPAKRGRGSSDEYDDLFPDMPEAKKRKFILVEDSMRGSRLRVRVTLEGVDTNEIPDSFRKGASVYPRSFFPREMQSPAPSGDVSRFFPDDVQDDGNQETEGREVSRRAATRKVKAPLNEGRETEVSVPQMRRTRRTNEVKLNDLAYRMAWLQSRVFSGRTVFLQRALDCYRNKTRAGLEGTQVDLKATVPHFEARAGKRRWGDRVRNEERDDDDDE